MEFESSGTEKEGGREEEDAFESAGGEKVGVEYVEGVCNGLGILN